MKKMAAGGSFQLFPPTQPPPRRDSNNPFRRPGGRRLSVIPNAGITTIMEDTAKEKDSPVTQKTPESAVLIQIYKEASPIQPPAEAHVVPERSTSPAEVRREPNSVSQPPATDRYRAKSPPNIDTGIKRTSLLLGRSDSLITTAANDDNNSTPQDISPVVPMRSMFPRYNPSVPLDRQAYYPQQRVQSPDNLPTRSVSRNEYSPSDASVSRIDELVGGPKTAPASIIEFPLDSLDIKPPRISSTPELGNLWEAANGQGPEYATGSFTLKMSRMAEAVFTFGSTPNLPFYTLETFSNNELSISRTHPVKPRMKIPILQLNLETPSITHSSPTGAALSSTNLPLLQQHQQRSTTPEPTTANINNSTISNGTDNDNNTSNRGELITYIFPKLAAMLAIDQCEDLAIRHRLAPTEKLLMQSDAVTRAAAQEASRLYWNEREKRYELAHPAIGKDQPGSPGFNVNVNRDDAEAGVGGQTSGGMTMATTSGWNDRVLHITVTGPGMMGESSSSPSANSPESPDDRLPFAAATGCTVISITNPNPPPPLSSVTANRPAASRESSAEDTAPIPSRMSTVPNPDTSSTYSYPFYNGNDSHEPHHNAGYGPNVAPPLASLTFYPPSTTTTTTPSSSSSSSQGPILHLDTPQITTLLPSLYAIDSLVSALLAVAVADSVSNGLMADLPVYDPMDEYRAFKKAQSRLTISIPGAVATANSRNVANHSNYAGSEAGGDDGEGGGVYAASTVGGKSLYANSVFYATVAEPEEAEEEARLMRALHSKDLKKSGKGGLGGGGGGGGGRRSKGGFSSRTDRGKSMALSIRNAAAAFNGVELSDFSDNEYDQATKDITDGQKKKKKNNNNNDKKSKKSKNKHKKPQKITIQEFDLEKYGTYQSGSRQGEKLPGTTRMILEMIFMLLKVVVWVLSTVVGVIAQVLVTGSRCLSSERF